MSGELLAVWPKHGKSIWAPLAKHSAFGNDLFTSLYREFVASPNPGKPVGELTVEEFDVFTNLSREYEMVVESAVRSRSTFRDKVLPSITTEQAAVAFLEDSFDAIREYGDEKFANSYFVRVEKFLRTFSLRYDLRRPFSLHPTLSGIFTSLVRDLKANSMADAHIGNLLLEFEESIRDLKGDTSSGRIKTCLQKQVNLLEAISRQSPGITRNTLGAICNELHVWPHDKVRDAVRSLYDFTSDYPGIRHGGTPANARREIEMKDLVAVAVLFMGFAPYLSHQLDSNAIFQE